MKKIMLICLFISTLATVFAQKPDTLWTKTYGGSQTECYGYGLDAQNRIDININNQVFIMSGTNSSDHDIHKSYGSLDCFVVKTSPFGDTIWTSIVGGNDYDVPRDILALDDGGCLVGGWTYSNSDLMVGHHGDTMSEDGFIYRLDSLGNLVWLKQYGGSEFIGIPGKDKIFDLVALQNGNFLALGQTNSHNGDLYIDLNGFYVGWVLEIDPQGNVEESLKKYWTLHDENNPNYFEEGLQLSDGSGYLCYGESQHSLTGSKLWLMKLDNNYNEVWQFEYGCNSFNTPYSITEGDSNSVVFTGWIQSGDGDVGGTYYGGNLDIWVAMVDASGSITHKQTIGGSEGEIPARIISLGSRREFYLCGSTRSTDYFGSGDTSTVLDFWLLKLDNALDTIWTFKPGGTDADAATDLVLSKQSNQLYMVGRSSSSDLYVHQNYGDRDIWVCLLEDLHVGIDGELIVNDPFIYPNPVSEYFQINKGFDFLHIYHMNGQLVESFGNCFIDQRFYIHHLAKGKYILVGSIDRRNYIQKLVVF